MNTQNLPDTQPVLFYSLQTLSNQLLDKNHSGWITKAYPSPWQTLLQRIQNNTQLYYENYWAAKNITAWQTDDEWDIQPHWKTLHTPSENEQIEANQHVLHKLNLTDDQLAELKTAVETWWNNQQHAT